MDDDGASRWYHVKDSSGWWPVLVDDGSIYILKRNFYYPLCDIDMVMWWCQKEYWMKWKLELQIKLKDKKINNNCQQLEGYLLDETNCMMVVMKTEDREKNKQNKL